MEGITLTGIINLLIQLFTLALIANAFWIVVAAIRGMATNRSIAWQAPFMIGVALIFGLWLLRTLPPEVMKSVRIGLENSRPERDALNNELRYWVPDILNGDYQPPAPTIHVIDLAPTSEPVVIVVTPTPLPTVWHDVPTEEAPPTIPPTATPLPTPCTYTVNGQSFSCPPTPER